MCTIASTSARLLTPRANRAPVVVAGSLSGRSLKPVKRSWERSMKYASSPTSIAVAPASVNCVLKVKPRSSKNTMLFWTSCTGMLTNSLRGVAGFVPAFRMVGAGACVVDMEWSPVLWWWGDVSGRDE